MPDLDFESAQLQLLTDALRAGPGSPVWREALASLDAETGADEYKLLYTARQRLASGREYRELRPGPGFTQKVFDTIEREEAGTKPRGALSANVIAGASAVVILAVVAVVVYFALPRSSSSESGAGGALSQTYFTVTRAQTRFESQLGTDWKPFGPLEVHASDGLRPSLDAPATAPSEYHGGGVTYSHEMPAGQAFAIETTLRAPRGSDDLIAQVFVSDDGRFSGDRATTPHELVWLVRQGEASVALPDGTIVSQGTKVPPGRSVEVRIAINRTQASVEMNGKRLWSGASQLAVDRPRVIGIRFLARGKAAQKDAPVVESVRVLTPQP
jgi:hypothetical protein